MNVDFVLLISVFQTLEMQRIYQSGGKPVLSELCRLCCAYQSFMPVPPELPSRTYMYSICPSKQKHWNYFAQGVLCNVRSFSTSHRCFRAKVSQQFDDYYTAIVEATKTSKRFQLLQEKFKDVNDPDEQEILERRWKFIEAVDFYIDQTDSTRRRHTDFIYDALKQMKKYGVDRDLACYKALIKVIAIS